MLYFLIFSNALFLILPMHCLDTLNDVANIFSGTNSLTSKIKFNTSNSLLVNEILSNIPFLLPY